MGDGGQECEIYELTGGLRGGGPHAGSTVFFRSSSVSSRYPAGWEKYSVKHPLQFALYEGYSLGTFAYAKGSYGGGGLLEGVRMFK